MLCRIVKEMGKSFANFLSYQRINAKESLISQIWPHLTSFDLEDIDLGSWNSHTTEFLGASTYPPILVFLASIGAEILWGEIFAPPSTGRSSRSPSTARVKSDSSVFQILDIHFCLLLRASVVPTTSFGSNNLASWKCDRCCAQSSTYVYTTTL